jgi:hypothetical protein
VPCTFTPQDPNHEVTTGVDEMEQRTLQKRTQSPEARHEKAAAVEDRQGISGMDQRKVAALAYRLYEARGREDGHDLDDWLEAEQLVASRQEGTGL